MTKDSIKYIKHKDPQTLNAYAYVNNNPVNHTDPEGTSWQDFERGLGNRIVDFITKTGEAWEAKSGKYVCNSPQLDVFMRQFKTKFNLVINETTEYSRPLLKSLERTGGNLYRMVDGKLIQIDIVKTLETGKEALKAPPTIFFFPPGWENGFQEDYGT